METTKGSQPESMQKPQQARSKQTRDIVLLANVLTIEDDGMGRQTCGGRRWLHPASIFGSLSLSNGIRK